MTSNGTSPASTAEIIYEKPPSGALKEISFGSDRGNTLWVRFTDADGISEWIGKFGCGISTSMRVTKAVEPDRFMVVAGGFAYLVDATKRTLLNRLIEDYVHDVAYDPFRNQFIAGDTCLRMIEDGRDFWASARFAADGIHSLCIMGRILSGIAVVGYEGEEARFEFDLDAREFVVSPWRRPCGIRRFTERCM